MPLARFCVVLYKRAVLSQEVTRRRLLLVGEKVREEMPSWGGLLRGCSVPGSILISISTSAFYVLVCMF